MRSYCIVFNIKMYLLLFDTQVVFDFKRENEFLKGRIDL
ncbi:hypothetical protein BHY_1044 (plasmid) [Borrelia nietonii YOR]|uniref:Uncharacterized protein n=1 Tax=Borrelia nietonii YOR TaxID=1293576 RepID=W5SAN5_9SPIR|nr:hypothetical protein BHY_1044 [Borrelia nietonii YOR]